MAGRSSAVLAGGGHTMAPRINARLARPKWYSRTASCDSGGTANMSTFWPFIDTSGRTCRQQRHVELHMTDTFRPPSATKPENGQEHIASGRDLFWLNFEADAKMAAGGSRTACRSMIGHGTPAQAFVLAGLMSGPGMGSAPVARSASQAVLMGFRGRRIDPVAIPHEAFPQNVALLIGDYPFLAWGLAEPEGMQIAGHRAVADTGGVVARTIEAAALDGLQCRAGQRGQLQWGHRVFHWMDLDGGDRRQHGGVGLMAEAVRPQRAGGRTAVGDFSERSAAAIDAMTAQRGQRRWMAGRIDGGFVMTGIIIGWRGGQWQACVVFHLLNPSGC
jgi:hypothetical protein